MTFWALAAVVFAGNALLAGPIARIEGYAVAEWPVAFDLLLLVPFGFLWVYRKGGRAAWVGAAALFGTGVVFGRLILPVESQHFWPVLVELRYGALAAVFAAQLVLIAIMLREVLRARATQNLETAVDAALAKRFGRQPIANLFRLEARMWLYALMRRPVTHPFPGHVHFHCHLQHGNASNQQAFLILALFEIPIAHILIHLFAGPTSAIVVTALSIYGLVFLLAEYRATVHRPVSIVREAMHLRYGVLNDVRIPLNRIIGIEPWQGPVRRAKGRLRCVGMGAANVRVALRKGTVLARLVGERVIEEIFIGIDQPQQFRDALLAAIASTNDQTVGASTISADPLFKPERLE